MWTARREKYATRWMDGEAVVTRVIEIGTRSVS